MAIGMISALKRHGTKAMRYISTARRSGWLSGGAAGSAFSSGSRSIGAFAFGAASLMGVGLGGATAIGFGAQASGAIRKPMVKYAYAAAKHVVRNSGTYSTMAGIAGAGVSLGVGITKSSLNMPKPRGVGPVMHGSGYTGWATGRSGGMNPNHLSATGSLTLAMHNNRHKVNPNHAGLY